MTTATRFGAMTFEMPTETLIVATRHLDAPRRLVWEAHTRCEHVQRWQLGPDPGSNMPVCEIDARPGGRYHYVYDEPNAQGFEMSGEFREVVEYERIVNTETYDDGNTATLNMMTLSDQDGGTLVRQVVEYPSEQVRETMLELGMLAGWAHSYDRLEDYLHTMRQRH